MIVYVNGKFIDEKKASLSIHDHGFLYGDGIYETLRAYNGKLFVLDKHLKRLKHSADGIKLRLPMSLEKIGQAMHATVSKNKHKEAVVRLTITRGPGAYGFDPALCNTPTIAIVSRPFPPYPRWYHANGITAAVVSVRRNSVKSLPPHNKTTSCMNGIFGKMESLKLGAQEGIFLTLDGAVSEGTVSNVFIVKKGKLFTPALDGSLLAGTTRAHVLEVAKRLRIPAHEKRLTLTDLLHADELFLTNTTMEVLPIACLIDNTKGTKRKHRFNSPGFVSRRLMESFR